MNQEVRSKPLVVSCASTIFHHLLKDTIQKSLFVTDEHDVLFMNEPPCTCSVVGLEPPAEAYLLERKGCRVMCSLC